MNGENGSEPSLLDYLNFGSKTATGVLGALNPPKQTTVVQKSGTNWTVIGGIAAAALGVLLLVLVAFKK